MSEDRAYAVDNIAHSLRRQIAEAQAKLDLLTRVPSRDTYPDQQVIRVVVRRGAAGGSRRGRVT